MRFSNTTSNSLATPIQLVVLLLAAVLVLTSTSGCFLLAAGAAGGEAGYIAAQEDRTAEETVRDQGITASVKSKLVADGDVSGFDINVDTFKQQVTLKGVVDSEQEKQKALQIARSVSGVKSVTSKLVVQ